MAADQFSLCWNNFHSNLSSGFHSLYQSEDFVDVTLAVEGRYLKAHKMVLSVCSQYFKELFIVNPCKHPIVILRDVTYSALRDLLQFMYLGEVSVSQEELGNLMKVAEMLQIKGLTEENVDTAHNNHNGLKNVQVSNIKTVPDSRTFLKRSKPFKKSKPEIPPKVHKLDVSVPECSPASVDGSINISEISASVLEPELLVTPKQEPLDLGAEGDASDEHSMTDVDVSMMLDTSLGIGGEGSTTGGSFSQMCWKSEANPMKIDTKNPAGGGLRFLTTPKGRTVVIHNGHMYTLSQHCQQHRESETKSAWVCVMQRKLNCPGQVTTCTATAGQQPPILLSYTGHNHKQLNDIIQRLDTQTLL